MFRPNTTCQLIKKAQGYNKYGEESFSAPVTVPCAVVRLDFMTQNSTVRADSSGSRGNAGEFLADARLLFKTDVDVEVDDLVIAYGVSLKVKSVFPRISVNGVYDHNQVDLIRSSIDG